MWAVAIVIHGGLDLVNMFCEGNLVICGKCRLYRDIKEEGNRKVEFMSDKLFRG